MTDTTASNIELRDGLTIIATERRRQVAYEGYTLRHDQHHTRGELAIAASLYAMPDFWRRSPAFTFLGTKVPRFWPWADRFWKPTPDDRIHELAKAGALIAAEIDRLLAAQ